MSATDRTPEAREAGIRRVAKAQRARYPTKGDWFTVDQVEFLISVIDAQRADLASATTQAAELRAERDARMALFNTAAEIAGAAIADLQRDLANARNEIAWIREEQTP